MDSCVSLFYFYYLSLFTVVNLYDMLNKLPKHAQCSTQQYFVLIHFKYKSVRGGGGIWSAQDVHRSVFL